MTTRPADTPARVLIVEDSATQAAALAALLEEAGYLVRIARSGEQALVLLSATPTEWDLVLSDVVMPGMDGYELCRRVKTELHRHDLPVLLVTSLTDPLDIVRGLESGADNYVTKPYDPTRLLARMETVLAMSAERGVAAQGRPVEVTFQGVTFKIGANKEQIVDLLVSSYEDLVRTSEAVRVAERRARFVADAGELLSSSLESEVILRHLARLAVPAMADLCVVDVLDATGRLRRVEQAMASSATRDPATNTTLGPLATTETVARTGRPALVQDMATSAGVAAEGSALVDLSAHMRDRAALGEIGVRSYLTVPLVARGSTIGTLFLASTRAARLLAADDLNVATDLARRAALAVDNARLYREAQQATLARDDMLAIVSHDLRNPLHTIGMSAAFLAESLGTSPTAMVPASELNSNLGVIRRAVGRANALIQDLLDVSRIEAGQLAVNATSVDAATLLDDAMAEMSPLAAARSVRLEHAWDGPTVSVHADRGRVAQIFSNLIGNAIKFTPAGGRVRVTASVGARTVTYGVTDTGSGIPADHVPHLFDRFWQARRGGREGAGLGLFITKGIVDAHGGQIDVESTPGVGSSFRFSLPIERA